MNPHLQKLQAYPFEKLSTLINNERPSDQYSAVSLAIGEPKHPTPESIKNALASKLSQLDKYPSTRGSDELRLACATWLQNRFKLSTQNINENDNVLPVNGTREALFAFAQCIINPSKKPVALIPNPFYQIYEGAALLAGAEPVYYDCSVVDGDIPALWELEHEVWERCQLIYICTPSNPTGQLIPKSTLQKLIEHSLQHHFVIASDECYSEIYSPDVQPPMGLLHYAQELGNDVLQNCMAFYSLSKRSNAPGLRSGFVAGSADLIEQFLRYRTYHGCAMSLPIQAASIAAWSDEEHVKINRQLYQEKFIAVLKILNNCLPCQAPDAGFYLWPKLPIDDEKFCQSLYMKKNVLTLPGSYLARTIAGYNPGHMRARFALVATKQECVQAATRIQEFLQEFN
ncbi:MAG: succinyldiaminopimelate transaminase [Gammaproteobacteria bacterium]|nr:succinyldiaminopimelate transaminase [Gammaproteobacteria bacterium]